MIDAQTARRAWRRLESVHAMVYFAPEGVECYEAIGVTSPMAGYFGSRSAALGTVPDEVVVATFFNFRPGFVAESMGVARASATPEQFLGARLALVDVALRRALTMGVSSPPVSAALELAERAARAAAEHPEGRPLFAAHASLEWPDEPHLRLWHAQTLLREFRGDAHIAALVAEGLGGLDALISHAATGQVGASVLRSTRNWSDDEWVAGFESMRLRGLVGGTPDQPSLTEEGRLVRQRVERVTDTSTIVAYDVLGAEGCESLGEHGRVLSQAVIDAGLIPGAR